VRVGRDIGGKKRGAFIRRCQDRGIAPPDLLVFDKKDDSLRRPIAREKKEEKIYKKEGENNGSLRL